MKIAIRLLSVFALIVFLGSCFNRELRGKVRKSNDQKTYLIIEENCGPDNIIYIDGEIWPYKIGEKGEINAGEHILKCGGEIWIEIKEGKVFHFNYWGP